jgi:DNA-binding response OmpR family regulator
MPKTLMLVEDDAAIAEVVGLHLSQAGFRVRRARDGEEALRAVDAGGFDLMLLDLMLPGIDGLEVCRHLRSRPTYVPLIMISARASETHRVLGLELGADDYVPKPFSVLELEARVRALLRRADRQRAEQSGSAVLAFGGFSLDIARRELKRGDQSVPLTLREFDLLHFLVRHPDRIFSRSELLAHVWGSGFDGYDHTVNSHINRLRAKVEEDPQEPMLIQTVWGLGYRFAAASSSS